MLQAGWVLAIAASVVFLYICYSFHAYGAVACRQLAPLASQTLRVLRRSVGDQTRTSAHDWHICSNRSLSLR